MLRCSAKEDRVPWIFRREGSFHHGREADAGNFSKHAETEFDGERGAALAISFDIFRSYAAGDIFEARELRVICGEPRGEMRPSAFLLYESRRRNAI